MVSERSFSVDALAIELVDSERFLSETPVGGCHLLATELIPVIQRLAYHSDTDLYPSDYQIESWREQHEEFQDMLRKLEAGERGYAPGSTPMRNAWSRFLATGDLPKALTIEPEFEQWAARSAALASHTQELKQVLSAESRQIWATVGYLVATAKLIVVGVYASDYNCGDQRVLNRVLDTIKEARADYQLANELASSDGIRKAIEMSQRLEDETIAALSTVNEKRAQWLRSNHLCLRCERALGWGDRLFVADQHSHCPSQGNDKNSSPFTRPRWGMIGAALALLLVLANMFGAFDRTGPVVAGTAPAMNRPVAAQPSPRSSEVSECSPEAAIPAPSASTSLAPYYHWHLCEGEGCSFPKGLASMVDVPIYTEPSRASAVSLVVPSGARLIADDGVVITNMPGKIVLTDSIMIGEKRARAGETLFDYTAYGEGYALVRFRDGFYSCPVYIWIPTGKARREQDGNREEWYKVRNAAGSIGWALFQMDLIRDSAGQTVDARVNLKSIAGGGESGGCGQIPEDFLSGGPAPCL